jgi:hypothetical protein
MMTRLPFESVFKTCVNRRSVAVWKLARLLAARAGARDQAQNVIAPDARSAHHRLAGAALRINPNAVVHASILCHHLEKSMTRMSRLGRKFTLKKSSSHGDET